MMKIRPSLRLYLLISMFLTGVVTVVAMSIVSVNFYFSGMEFSKAQSMISSAFQETIEDGKPKAINEYVIATRWQDLPDAIHKHFDESKLKTGKLAKEVIGIPIFSPPKEAYFVIKIENGDDLRYVSQEFIYEEVIRERPLLEINFWYIIVIAAIAIILFSISPIFILRNIAIPIEKLILWSKQLNNEKLSDPIPPFHYHELDSLADIIQSSLLSVQESLEREMRFLGYASHELRTPISVTRTNTELLQKMIERNVDTDKQLLVLERIERASLTMTDLTETLLWLNRQQGKSLPIKEVKLGELTQRLADELSYLLKGKKVEVSLTFDDTILNLPETLCRIVITNLIRNAFQHTHEGTVNIEQSKHCLHITNQNTLAFNAEDELGFGLGLLLTERLIIHQNWSYKNTETQDGYHVEVEFSSH